MFTCLWEMFKMTTVFLLKLIARQVCYCIALSTRNHSHATAFRVHPVGTEPKRNNKYSILVETFLCCYKSESELNKYSLFRFTSQSFHRCMQSCLIQMKKYTIWISVEVHLLVLKDCGDSISSKNGLLTRGKSFIIVV